MDLNDEQLAIETENGSKWWTVSYQNRKYI